MDSAPAADFREFECNVVDLTSDIMLGYTLAFDRPSSQQCPFFNSVVFSGYSKRADLLGFFHDFCGCHGVLLAGGGFTSLLVSFSPYLHQQPSFFSEICATVLILTKFWLMDHTDY